MRFFNWFKIFIILGVLSVLSGCNWYIDDDAWKKPIPQYLEREIKNRGFKLGAPVLARMFKSENRFELWMEKDGKFKFFKSYGICSWSGKLGPKIREGDNQAPEGFYVVTPAQMNPYSKYHLSFNMGYPNFFDRSLGRTGSHLMVHGACSSRGCYALTDASIQEVYLLARDAFKNGQRRFHVQAFPFRLNEVNLDAHKDNKWISFWRNLAEGDRIFNLTGQPPKMSARAGLYIFSPADEQLYGTDTVILTHEPVKTITKPIMPPVGLWAYYSAIPADDMIKAISGVLAPNNNVATEASDIQGVKPIKSLAIPVTE